MFSDFQISLVLWIQKVANFLVVNFDVGDFNHKFEIWVGTHLVVRAIEEFQACQRNDAFVGTIYGSKLD